MRGLIDKVFIVAGGGSGIGAATARRLVEEGASVVIGDFSEENACAVANSLDPKGSRAVGVPFDIRSVESVQTLIAVASKDFGRLDGIHVNAAAIDLVDQDTAADDVTLELYDRTMAVNLRGHLICTKYAIPELLKNGGGSIVYTTSGAAFMGEPQRVAYAMSKSGLHALMRHVASRWGKENIRANAVAPGLVLTESAEKKMSSEARHAVLALTKSPRLGRGSDIAATVAFLMSEDAEWINGQILSIDGGATMR